MPKPFVVVFAGVPGSSKSIVAQHLSCEFSLPVFSTDIVRAEVKEDLLAKNIRQPRVLAEYEKRSTDRRHKILARGQSVILDSSVDRRWAEVKAELKSNRYAWFMIDMELSKKFLVRLFESTDRHQFVKEELDIYLKQHQDFMNQYAADVNIQITDKTFAKRLDEAAGGLKQFIARL